VLDDERAHLRAGPLLEVVPEAEDGADGVDGPVGRRRLEARPLAGARIPDLQHRADARRILGAAGQGCEHAIPRHQDQVLGARVLAQDELAAGETLILGARGAEHGEQEDDDDAGGRSDVHVSRSSVREERPRRDPLASTRPPGRSMGSTHFLEARMHVSAPCAHPFSGGRTAGGR